RSAPDRGARAPLQERTGHVLALQLELENRDRADGAGQGPGGLHALSLGLRGGPGLRQAPALRPGSDSSGIHSETMKLGIVATMTQVKKCRYPMWSWSHPLHRPGIIIPSAMNPVQIA